MYRNLLTTTMLLKFALFFMLGYLLQLLTLVELSSTAEVSDDGPPSSHELTVSRRWPSPSSLFLFQSFSA